METGPFVYIVYLLAKLCTIFDEAFFIDVSIYRKIAYRGYLNSLAVLTCTNNQCFEQIY